MNYTKIECGHELPEDQESYDTEFGIAFYFKKDNKWHSIHDVLAHQPTYWYKPLPEQPVDYEGLWQEFMEDDETIDYARFKKLIQQAVAQSSGCVVKVPEMNPNHNYNPENLNEAYDYGFYKALEKVMKLNPHVKFEQ